LSLDFHPISQLYSLSKTLITLALIFHIERVIPCFVCNHSFRRSNLEVRWAWQNTHLTRRIADEQRITARDTKPKTSPKTGRTRRRPARPKMSLRDKLMNLSLLLRVPSFSRLPLEVRFFCADVYQAWLRWSKVGNDLGASSPRVFLDIEQSPLLESDTLQAELSSGLPENTGVLGGVRGLDVTYVPIREHVKKSISLLDEGESTRCFLCNKEMDSKSTMVLTCPQEQCRSISHLSCLSQSFLSQTSNNSLVPDVGRCPSCRTELKWFELVKELTVRMRAEAIVTKTLAKTTRTKSRRH
jgi:structure-specific endonuclease subunit SLX1